MYFINTTSCCASAPRMELRSECTQIIYACAGNTGGDHRGVCMCQSNNALYFHAKSRLTLCDHHLGKRFTKAQLLHMVDNRALEFCSKRTWIKKVNSWTPARTSTRLSARVSRDGCKCLGCGDLKRGKATVSIWMHAYLCETCRTQVQKDAQAQTKREKMAAKVSTAAISSAIVCSYTAGPPF